jgi:4-hydroxy-3-methylbut-2-enyl diphosphate reductase IspH
METSEIVKTISSVGTFGFSIYVAVYLLTKTTVAFEKLAEAITRLEEKISSYDRQLNDIHNATQKMSVLIERLERK